MYTSDTKEKVKEIDRFSDTGNKARLSASGSGTSSYLTTGMKYLVAALIVAVAAAVYGLFSHGVYSYFMTYAFMIPLLGGAMPHLIAALKSSTSEGSNQRTLGVCGRTSDSETNAAESRSWAFFTKTLAAKDLQIAVIVTLTVGSLLKGALDIYGTTNSLLIAYPVLAILLLVAEVLLKSRNLQHSSIS